MKAREPNSSKILTKLFVLMSFKQRTDVQLTTKTSPVNPIARGPKYSLQVGSLVCLPYNSALPYFQLFQPILPPTHPLAEPDLVEPRTGMQNQGNADLQSSTTKAYHCLTTLSVPATGSRAAYLENKYQLHQAHSGTQTQDIASTNPPHPSLISILENS